MGRFSEEGAEKDNEGEEDIDEKGKVMSRGAETFENSMV